MVHFVKNIWIVDLRQEDAVAIKRITFNVFQEVTYAITTSVSIG